MRDIKFRAWDEINKKLIYQDREDGIGCFFVGLNEVYLEFDYKEDGYTKTYYNTKVLQYTGLKDKNGVEIYEGDIVKWGHIKNFEECWHRVAVVEVYPSLQFKIINYIDGKTLEYKKGDNHIFGYSNFIYKKTEKAMEIIGNIYENKELLENEKN